MNIHEYQAKKILKEFGAKVPEGFIGYSVDEIIDKAKSLTTKKYVLKAQIHAGGRGKAGGIKLVKNNNTYTLEDLLLREIFSIMNREDRESGSDHYLYGLKNILAQPEFADISKGYSIVEVVEDGRLAETPAS